MRGATYAPDPGAREASPGGRRGIRTAPAAREVIIENPRPPALTLPTPPPSPQVTEATDVRALLADPMDAQAHFLLAPSRMGIRERAALALGGAALGGPNSLGSSPRESLLRAGQPLPVPAPAPQPGCKFCALCKGKGRTTVPFHWCVDDTIASPAALQASFGPICPPTAQP